MDIEKFQRAYRKLLYVTKKNGSEPSFRKGAWFEMEGYKLKFWEQARTMMNLPTWPDHREDDAYIVACAKKPFNVWQNLVSPNNYLKLYEVFSKKPHESAQALYSIFFGSDDAKAFNAFARLIGTQRMYDPMSVVSFYFFLKDKDHYVTARRDGTGESLNKLGVNPSCLKECTWSGYQIYLKAVHEIQELLLPLHSDATFLDAQSFIWMLWQISYETPEYTLEPNRSTENTEIPDSFLHPETEIEYRQELVENPGPAPTDTKTVSLRKRKKSLAEIAKERAQGKCQLCGNNAPFIDKDGQPYLEAHHIVALSEDGPDDLRNMVALCPNCHRKMHALRLPEDVDKLKSLYTTT